MTHLDTILKNLSLEYENKIILNNDEERIIFNNDENTIECYYNEIEDCIKEINMCNNLCKVVISDSEGMIYYNDFIESELYFKEHFISKEKIIDNKSE